MGNGEKRGDAMSQDASADPVDGLINKGFFALNAGEARGGGRTFIVTGQQRSGTSLVAAVLRQVGIFMGTEINDQVHEDEALAKILLARDRDGLRRIIGERDANFGTWGFKFPMLCDVLAPADLAIVQQPACHCPNARFGFGCGAAQPVGVPPADGGAARRGDQTLAAVVEFVERLDCPVLLLSYEKSLVFPADFIDAIVRFGDLPQSEALRARLIALIEPNRRDYIEVARRQYSGLIEGIANGFLCGWSRLTGVGRTRGARTAGG